MPGKPGGSSSGKLEYMRQVRAVEQLRTIEKEIEMVSRLISSLSAFYMAAWDDVCAADTRIKHALTVLDDSGESERFYTKRWGK